MSLTDAENVFGGIHEDALNDMFHAFFSARPRYRRYGSPAFVPSTTVNETQMGAILFPGIAGGIDWILSFEIPRIDLFKQDAGLPPPLALGPGQFSLQTKVQICINCITRQDDHGDHDLRGRGDHHLERLPCTELGVAALGHIDSWHNSNGDGGVRLRVDSLELVDITPDSLEGVLECLIKMVLDAVLSQIELPLFALRAGAFELVVVRGPEIGDDQIKVFGNL